MQNSEEQEPEFTIGDVVATLAFLVVCSLITMFLLLAISEPTKNAYVGELEVREEER